MNQKTLVREVTSINKRLIELKELHDKKEMSDSQFNQAKQNLNRRCQFMYKRIRITVIHTSKKISFGF